jgi:polyisoprenyl-phosphate glycosyltransferase
MTQLAVVVPVYQGEGTIDAVVAELLPALERLTADYDVLLVNDGSSDASWQRIQALAAQHPRVRGLSLIRNFGEHVAITAGIDHVDAQQTIIMACDLQDDPAVIKDMVAKAGEGCDLVLVRRLQRKDAWLKRTLARIFYAAISLLFHVDYDYRVGNFRLLSRDAVEYFRQYRERARNVNAIMALMRLPTGYVDMVHRPRQHGQSTYTLRRSALMAANVLLGYSQVPLLLSGVIGLLLFVGALGWAGWLTVETIRGRVVSTVAIVITSVTGMGGLVLLNLGIVGAYLGRAATEAKERPIYYISSRAGRF